ncbi:MFS transporter [Micromonospora sp. NBC_01412]|uniref:MFS transporter n=1 Tax=Micromonospora sp. NBC_01412 TaxID=2903590 RepID=UPI003253475A
MRPLRTQPVFRRLWLGTTASGFGSQLGTFAVTFYVWESSRSPLLVGLIGLFTAVPLIAFALLGTAFADHVDRRRLALVTTLGQLATSLLMAGVAAGLRDRVWAMLVLVGVSSALAALNAPARQAFLPRLLPAEQLSAGLALNHLSFQLAMLLGPAVAGILTAGWGTTLCFVVDALTFVAALVGIRSLPPTRAADSDGRAGASAAWQGIRFALRTPPVRGAFLLDLCATVLAMPVALFPVVNEEKFHGSPEVLGLLTSAMAVGGVVASMLSGLITNSGRSGRVLLGCCAVWGASLAGVGLAGNLALVLVLLAVAGAADTWSVVSRGTIVQFSTPESHRGRVASLDFLVGAAGPRIGGLRAGLVAAASSGGTALLVGGITCLAGIALTALATPHLGRFTTAWPVPPGRDTTEPLVGA